MTTHNGFPRDFNWQWNSCVTYAYLEVPISLTTKNRQFVVIGGRVSCRNNNLWCHQWWQSCQIDHLMYNWPFVREIYWPPVDSLHKHYNDIIMTTMASQITSLTVVYSTVHSDAYQRKHQSSASLAFVWGIHRDRWIPSTKGQVRRKCFHLMKSSWVSSREFNVFIILIWIDC